MPRWSKLVLAVVAVLLLAGAAALAVAWVRLPQIVAERASKATGRTVAIGALTLSPGRWIGVDLRDVRMANLPGGSRPDMASLGRLTGEVALGALLHGSVVARDVRVEKAHVLLEKVNGQPNWRNGPKRPESADHGRPGFPTLLGLQYDGTVTFRTSSGTPLVTKLDGVRLEAASASAPARLTGPGSYQGAPVALDLKLGSFDQLHDAATPFPTDVTLTSGDTVVHFVGTMTDPLNVDGATGRLSLAAPTPDPLEKMAGMSPSPAPPLRLQGAFQHQADLWRMEGAEGALDEAKLVGGSLQLREGSTEAHKPDQIALDLRFDRMDVDQLLAAFKSGNGGGGGSGGETSFVPDSAPDPEVTANLQAATLTYGKIPFTQPKLGITLQPNLLKLDGVSFGALGGDVRLDGQIAADADGKNGVLSATLNATGLGVGELKGALGIGEVPLAGRMDLHATAEGKAATAAAALRSGRTELVATMNGGSVSAQLVELASTDVAGLFRSKQATVPLRCLLAVMEVRGGRASVGPLRLRSAAGTIVARGEVDLLRDTMDIVVASEARTTGALALDVPVRLTGRLDDPTIAPAGADAGRAALAARSTAGLPASLRAVAQRSDCAR